jgi:hypothetical protein
MPNLGRVCTFELWTIAAILAVSESVVSGPVLAEPVGPVRAVELFNGRDLDGWLNVNGAPETWSVRDGHMVCSGKPSGFLRTDAMYENYVLEWEWRHAAPGGNGGLFVHADALPQIGAPFPRSIEIQLFDGDHGSIFGIRGATIVPVTNPDLKGGTPQARPIENRALPAGQWNRYVLTSKDGALELAVNGQVVTKASNCSQRKGFLGLQAEGSEIHFRNLRLKRLPDSKPLADQVAQADEGLRSIFDGVSFAGWQFREAFQDHWIANDGVLRCDGQNPGPRGQIRDLWSEREYDDFVLLADWRLPRKPEPKNLPTFTPDGLYALGADGKALLRELDDAGDSGIFLRGSDKVQVNIWCQPMGSGDINDYDKDANLPVEIRQACVPKKKADKPPGQWNCFVISMRGDRVTVILNGETVIDRATLPGAPPRGRIGLQNHNDPVEFRNVFIKELD